MKQTCIHGRTTFLTMMSIVNRTKVLPGVLFMITMSKICRTICPCHLSSNISFLRAIMWLKLAYPDVVREKCCEQVRNEISKLPALQLESIIPNSNDALSIVNDRISAVNECVLQVADGLCHNASFKQYKAKPLWSPELVTFRNKNKFWWNLWVPDRDIFLKFGNLVKKHIVNFTGVAAILTPTYGSTRLTLCLLRDEPYGIYWSLRGNHPVLILISMYLLNILWRMIGFLILNRLKSILMLLINTDVIEIWKWMCGISQTAIANNIRRLKRNCALGIDGVTTEHMLYALSDTFCTELMNLYSTMFKLNVSPDVLKIGIIVPILKKSTLSDTVCENFWPITLSSVHAKLVEMLILPNTNTNICGNQYGYQADKGTEFCCALLNDSVAYFNEGDSPVYMCTLDAVKCFDNIWHEGFIHKLWNRMDIVHWRLLYNWYKSMRATVLLNGDADHTLLYNLCKFGW